MNRNEIVESNYSWVKTIAKSIKNKYRIPMDLEDLVSIGVIGLINCIENFDVTRDVKFRTYAEYRVKGAIFDELRNQNIISRLVKNRIELMKSAITAIERQTGNNPTTSEIASEMKIDVNAVHSLRLSMNMEYSVSLEDIREEDPDLLRARDWYGAELQDNEAHKAASIRFLTIRVLSGECQIFCVNQPRLVN